MSADKRKKFMRACARLREINCDRYPPRSVTRSDPVLRYIIKRGMGKLKRMRQHSHMTTFLDTGVQWARQWQRGDLP